MHPSSRSRRHCQLLSDRDLRLWRYLPTPHLLLPNGIDTTSEISAIQHSFAGLKSSLFLIYCSFWLNQSRVIRLTKACHYHGHIHIEHWHSLTCYMTARASDETRVCFQLTTQLRPADCAPCPSPPILPEVSRDQTPTGQRWAILRQKRLVGRPPKNTVLGLPATGMILVTVKNTLFEPHAGR